MARRLPAIHMNFSRSRQYVSLYYVQIKAAQYLFTSTANIYIKEVVMPLTNNKAGFFHVGIVFLITWHNIYTDEITNSFFKHYIYYQKTIQYRTV